MSGAPNMLTEAMARILLLALLSVPACISFNSALAEEDLFKLLERRCAKGQGADEHPFWEFIANNARRTADDYATKRNPNAVFATAKVEAVFQLAGKHAGEYLIILLYEGPLDTSLAVLRPNFKFCADPSSLDDSRFDLFSVVKAKLNGKPF